MRYVRRVVSVSVVVVVGLCSRPSGAQTKPVTHSPVVNGIGDPRSVVQTPSFGTISEQIALALPPGRRNLLPKLNFTYVSTGGVDLAGVGWQLEAGHVDRSIQNGVPSFTDADLFTLSVGGGSSDLAAIGGGNYRAKFESQYRLATKVGDSWQVREAQGTLYKFGSTADSKVSDPGGTMTASWMLDLIQDTNGNTITFKYLRDHGALYISEIDYTGYAPTSDPGLYKITFTYDSTQRPDPRKNFASGVEVDGFLRLSGVSIFAGSAPVRSYVVNYTTSPTNGRSLVSSLNLVGDDGASSVTARSYTYQSRTLGWPTTSSGSLPRPLNGSDGHDLGVRLIDVNGDNFVDLVENGNAVYLGNGAGSFTPDPGWTSSIAAIGVPFVVQVGSNPGLDNGVRLLDVNGDGRPDVVIANLTTHEVFLNTGSGWAVDSAYSTSIQGITETSTVQPSSDAGVETVPFSIVGQDSDSLGVQFADVNGDGLPDIVWSFQITSGLGGTSPLATDAGIAARAPQSIEGIWLNTGTGFARDNTRSQALGQAVPDSFVSNTQVQGFDVLDVNGDGLADIIRTLDGTARVVLINTGSAWTQDADYTASLQAATNLESLSSDRKSLGLLPVDFNNDGLLDYIRSTELVPGGPPIRNHWAQLLGWPLASGRRRDGPRSIPLHQLIEVNMRKPPAQLAIAAAILILGAAAACSSTPAARAEGGAGGSQGDGAVGAEMVSVPAGAFMMGCNSAVDTSCNPDESPYHSVSLAAFSIDKTEVTEAAYSACIAAGVCLAIQGLPSDQVPVHDMTFANAMTYCTWAGKRLPTEAEWEKAARGTDGRIYPWGNTAPNCDQAVFGTCATAPAAVGGRTAGASPYGALDMAGNVAEWVSDFYAADYYASSPGSAPPGPSTGTDHVDRGGWYRSSAAQVRVSFREANSGDTAVDYIGFRCAH